MGLFNKDIKVKCYTVPELNNLIAWLRSQWGLSGLRMTRFHVTVGFTNVFAEEQGVTYFEVEVPHHMYKQLRKEYIEKEVFDPVLEQRAFSEILGREL